MAEFHSVTTRILFIYLTNCPSGHNLLSCMWLVAEAGVYFGLDAATSSIFGFA